MPRPGVRDLGITIGSFPTGQHNAITDVPDLWVGHKILIYDQPRVARIGLTVIVPREGQIWRDNAFATGNSIPVGRQEPFSIRYLPNYKMNPLFSAVGEAVEEAILNVLTAAGTMTGFKGHTAYALPLDDLVSIMESHGPAR